MRRLFKKVIAAEGEQKASSALREAADIMKGSSASLQVQKYSHPEWPLGTVPQGSHLVQSLRETVYYMKVSSTSQVQWKEQKASKAFREAADIMKGCSAFRYSSTIIQNVRMVQSPSGKRYGKGPQGASQVQRRSHSERSKKKLRQAE